MDLITNPFHKVISEFSNAPKTLTINILNRMQEYFKEANQYYTTDEIFKILNYLADANILVIEQQPEDKSFKIKLK